MIPAPPPLPPSLSLNVELDKIRQGPDKRTGSPDLETRLLLWVLAALAAIVLGVAVYFLVLA